MALRNKSEVSTIEGPEFLNLQPLDQNPLMSKCEIKVFYLGHNRNGSYINRETAEKMAKTLRGTPIVAAYKEDKEDFGDHGRVVHIEDGEIKFSCKTVPYGFVSPDAEVWFQKFTDIDEFDNSVERTYLMTTGYLWEGQFQELKKVLEEGQPHSMEIDEKSLDGHWAKDNNLGVEFFIINDAVFSKLCILGDDVEPCFEGSSVTSPDVSKNFSLEDKFQHTLFSMMNELTDAIQGEGGLKMPNELTEQKETVDESAEFAATEDKTEEVQVEEPVDEPADYTNAEDASETGEAEVAFESKDDDKDDSDDDDADSDSEDKDEDDDEKPASNHSLEEFEALKVENESLRAEIESLREFKLTVENEQKDALIDSFPYNTLSAEDKAEIVEHKSEYSLEEIEAKLAVLYVKKGVHFEAEPKTEEEPAEEDLTTFSLDGEVEKPLTGLQEALHKTIKQ